MTACEYEIPAKYYLLTHGCKDAAAKADAKADPKADAKATAKVAANDEIDLFGDDASDDGADLKAVMAAKKKEAEAAKKPKKVVIAKSSVTLRALPYDGERDITSLYESAIKKIEIDGLLWGAPCTIVNGPFGLRGIQFGCVVEDEKVKTDDIEEAIETIGLSAADAKKYIELRRTGDLDDYEEEWEGKMVGTLEVVAFQKI